MFLHFAVIVVSACWLACGPAYAEKRVALVIGNGDYKHAPRLSNPANDANDVAAALSRSGFDTIVKTDLDWDGMVDATIRFARAARGADVALFYYSGHALQFNGVNYLAPVDTNLTDESDLRRMTRVDEIVSDLQQAKNLRILVLDSCRDNPLAEQLRRSIGNSRAIPLQRGLAKMDTPQGAIVAYATQAGQEAADGTGRNSPYTTAFVKHIEERDEIGTIFREISEDVYETTGHAQLPEFSLSIIGRFYLRGKVEASVEPNAPQAASPGDTMRSDFEAAERVDTVAGWDAFLVQHPKGFYSTLARERRNKVAGKGTASQNTSAAIVPSGQSRPSTSPQQTIPSPLLQRAVLYDEDPNDHNGKQFVGSVVWRTEPIKAYGNQKADIAVRADIDIPDRKFKMTMSFRRNTDISLPASHTVELTFLLPPEFSSGGIASVAGILMKSNEQARGTPLAGLAVKVVDGFFLVGLSNVDSERAHNIQLLRERVWIDVPLVYTNQRRAIIAIEKGAPGQRAFDEAFAAWVQSSPITSTR